MARVSYTSLKRLAAQVPQNKKDLMITHQVLEIFGSDGREECSYLNNCNLTILCKIDLFPLYRFIRFCCTEFALSTY